MLPRHAQSAVQAMTQGNRVRASSFGDDWDSVVSLCGCGVSLPEDWAPEKLARFADWKLDDPPALAKTAANEEEAIGHYRRVRDEIKAFVETLPESITAKEK